MNLYFAFLRAINVGGHVVKMDRLRQIFESLGFSDVETFIASGNGNFKTKSGNARNLERRIENALREALGYDVATFIRTADELVDIATYQAFTQSDLADVQSLNIMFLGEAMDDESRRRTVALKTDIDLLHVHGREVYWLCRKRQSDSSISNAAFQKALGGISTTVRGLNTVRKMAAKYCPEQ
jgi:uncharacterized protein (DUF1697 family)